MRYAIFSFALLFSIGCPVWAAEGPPENASENEPLVLSLEEAIRNTLEGNTDLRVEKYNPKIRQSEIIIQEAGFDPGIRLGTGGGRAIRPSASAVDVAILAGAVSPIESSQLDYTLGLDQRLATGTDYQLAFDLTREGGPTTAFDPNFSSSLALKVTQPLLKGFGFDSNRTELILARNNFAISMEAFEGKVAEIVAQLEDRYWELVYQRKNHKVQIEKRRAAQELLEMNKAKAQQGLIPPVEVLVAEATVAGREEDILVAEKGVRDSEDQLRLAMNRNGPSPLLLRDYPIIPTDEPDVRPIAIDRRAASEVALVSRWDLRQARIELQNQEQRARLTGNQALPALDLKGSAGLTGLGASYADQFDRLTSGDFYSWEVGMVFTMPLGNRAARQAHLKQKLEYEKAGARIQKMEQDIVIELKEAARRVETDQKRIGTTGKSRQLAEKKLETEMERLRLGLSTSQDVLEFQKDLAEAQNRELKAITDYNKSLSNFGRVQGTLLRDRGIRVDPGSARVGRE